MIAPLSAQPAEPLDWYGCALLAGIALGSAHIAIGLIRAAPAWLLL